MEEYKKIFEEIISEYKYDYSQMFIEDLISEIESIYTNNLNTLHLKLIKLTNQKREDFKANILLDKLEEIKLSIDKNSYIKLKNIYKSMIIIEEKIDNFNKNKDNNKEYGVCIDFSIEFINRCIEKGLVAYFCKGAKEYNENYVNHMWNYVIIGNEVKHIDISSAIHAIDEGEDPYKYFCIDFEEFEKLDKNNKRIIGIESKVSIENAINNNNFEEKKVVL